MERLYVTLVVDRSGSMEPQRMDVIESVNAFKSSLEKEAQDKDVRLTIILFDNEYIELVKDQPIRSAADLNMENYTTRGSTALLDAVHRAITTTEEAAKKYKLGEATSIIAVMTDGQENSSQEIKDPAVIKKMIEDRESDENWSIAFLGSDISTWDESKGLGLSRGNVAHLQSKNVKGTMDAFGKSVVNYANAGGPQKRLLKSNLIASNAADYLEAGTKVDKDALEKFENAVTPSETGDTGPDSAKSSKSSEENS